MREAFHIRSAVPDDAAAVTAVLATSYPTLMAPAYEADALAAALPFMTRAHPGLLGSGRYYVAETGKGGIIACGGWSLDDPGSGTIEAGVAHVRHFATHPDHVGQGAGRAVYLHCEAAAKEVGIRRFECQAGLNAIGFYEALGFTALRRIEVAMSVDAGIASMLMEKRF